jgi:A/G-specific adenine glycosylase
MSRQKKHNQSFAERLLAWYHRHGRKSLPWQQDRNAYRVWVSEIMLQQTQVETVIPYFERFMQRFPDVLTLANAEADDVLHHWSGLGYYARARNLHAAAQLIRDDYQGELPRDIEQLNALPGVGRSTAAAILAQAHGLCHAILDGNVKRVLARYHAVEGWTGHNRVQQQLWQYAELHTPSEQVTDYTQAIMDLGSMVCSRSRPRCNECPLVDDCEAFHSLRTDQLPTPKPRKVLPVKAARMLVLVDGDNRVMLEKRPPSGIWGGLWSLPEMPPEDDVAEHCRRHWQFEVDAVSDGEGFRHTFSHYHLDITPCRVRVKNPDQSVMEDERVVWYNIAQPDRLGLATPVKTILQNLKEAES